MLRSTACDTPALREILRPRVQVPSFGPQAWWSGGARAGREGNRGRVDGDVDMVVGSLGVCGGFERSIMGFQSPLTLK